MKLAVLCYLKQAGKTLMLHRVKKIGDIHLGKYNGLGGKIEAGESPEECARREISEESGLRAGKLDYAGTLTFPMFDDKDDWYCWVYTCSDFSGELISSNEGNLLWVNNENINSLELWEGDRIFLKWIEDKKIFSAKFIYRSKKLISHQVEFYEHS